MENRPPTRTALARLIRMFLGAFMLGTIAGSVVILAMTAIIDGGMPKNVLISVAVAATLSALITAPLIMKSGHSQGEARLRPHATVEVSTSISEAFSCLRDNVSRVRGATLSQAEPQHGTLIIKTQASAESFGEVITVTFTPLSATSVKATIKSRPRYPLTLIDAGKNEDNVHTILEILRGGRP